MKKTKQKKAVKKDNFIIKGYHTERVGMEVTTIFDSKSEGDIHINIVATYDPQANELTLSNFSGISARPISLEKAKAIAEGLNNLIKVIERQEKLRELAEGFGRSMEEHKENK